MKRFILALRVALAAFVAWLRYSPSREFRVEAKANLDAMAQELGPYRKAAKREIDGPWIDPALPPYIDTNEPNAWAEAQRDLTPADMRAAEARRQNVIVGPPDVPDTPPGRPYFD